MINAARFAALLGTRTGGGSTEPPPGGGEGGDWSNGFAVRRDIVIPADQITATISNVLLCVKVDLTGDTEAAGADLRFETTAGSVLAYHLNRYASSVAYCIVRLPTLTNATQYKFHAYVGDASPGTQTNDAGTFIDFLAAWDTDGSDLTGNGWNLTPTGTAVVQLASGFDALDYDLGDITTADVVFTTWDASAEFTFEALVDRDTATETATLIGFGSAPGFYTQYASLTALQQSVSGTIDLPITVDSLTEGGGSTYTLGPAFSADVLGETVYTATWERNSAPIVYRDGEALSASVSAARDALTEIWPAESGIYLGRRLDGTLGFPRVAAVPAFEAAKVAIHARSMLVPERVYGIGASYTSADEATPPVVAVPMTATVEAGNSVDVDIAGSAITTGTATLQSVTQGQRSGSTVTIESGQARYTPGGTIAGTDYFTGTVSDGIDTSVARVTVTITEAAGVEESYLRTVNVSTAAALTTALGSAIAGDDIVLSSGTYAGDFTMSASGTAANPIRIRAATQHGAIMTGRIVVNGAYNRVRNLRWNASPTSGDYVVDLIGNNPKVQGCFFNGTKVSGGAQRAVVRGNGANDAIVEYNAFTQWTGRAIGFRTNVANGLRCIARRNHCYNDASTGTGFGTIAIGVGGDSDLIGPVTKLTNAIVEYNLCDDVRRLAIQSKTSAVTIRFNNCTATGQAPDAADLSRSFGGIEVREGTDCVVNSNTCSGAIGPIVHGRRHIIAKNFNNMGGSPTGGTAISAMAGQGTFEDVTDPGSADFQLQAPAENCTFIENEGTLVIGGYYNSWIAGGVVNAANIDREGHIGTVNQSIYVTNSTTSAVSESYPARVVLTPANTGPAALPA